MVEKASYWKNNIDNTYVIQITMFFCKKTRKKIKEELRDWFLAGSGHSRDRKILIYKREINSTKEWKKIKKTLSFSEKLQQAKG